MAEIRALELCKLEATIKDHEQQMSELRSQSDRRFDELRDLIKGLSLQQAEVMRRAHNGVAG